MSAASKCAVRHVDRLLIPGKGGPRAWLTNGVRDLKNQSNLNRQEFRISAFSSSQQAYPSLCTMHRMKRSSSSALKILA